MIRRHAMSISNQNYSHYFKCSISVFLNKFGLTTQIPSIFSEEGLPMNEGGQFGTWADVSDHPRRHD